MKVKNTSLSGSEMVQQLQGLAAEPNHLGSIPRAYVVEEKNQLTEVSSNFPHWLSGKIKNKTQWLLPICNPSTWESGMGGEDPCNRKAILGQEWDPVLKSQNNKLRM